MKKAGFFGGQPPVPSLKAPVFKPQGNLNLQKGLVESLRLQDPTRLRVSRQNLVWVTPKVEFSAKLAQLLVLNADLRPQIKSYGLEIKNQGMRGTCSVFAMTFLLEYNYATWGEKNKTRLSEEYLNWATNDATGRSDDGDFFSNISKGFKYAGICNLPTAPYQSAYNPGWKPTKLMRDEGSYRSLEQRFWVVFDDGVMGISQAELEKICTLLDNKVPVAIGQAWPSSQAGGKYVFSDVLGVNCLTDLTGPAGGHSTVAVGYKRVGSAPGGGYFVFRNSWGTDSGYEGYWFISFAYVRKYAYDAYAAAWDGIK